MKAWTLTFVLIVAGWFVYGNSGPSEQQVRCAREARAPIDADTGHAVYRERWDAARAERAYERCMRAHGSR